MLIFVSIVCAFDIISICMLNNLSCVWLLATLWTVAHQAPLCMGFSRREYWSGLPCPPPGDLSNLGIKPTSVISPALALGLLPGAPPGKPKYLYSHCQNQCINFSPTFSFRSFTASGLMFKFLIQFELIFVSGIWFLKFSVWKV